MTDILNKKIKSLFPNKLLGISLCFFFILGCSSLSKKIPLNSKNLTFKIQWNYSSPLKEEHSSFLSVISIQGDKRLRLDILQPFVGAIGGFIVNEQDMVLLAPFQKQYYKGAFDSKVFFPDFPPFSGLWLIALLRAKPPDNWKCQKSNKRLSYCQTDHFELKWIYKNSRLNKIHIRDSKQRQITAQIKSLSSNKLSEQLFEPSLQNWKKQTEPSFFQDL